MIKGGTFERRKALTVKEQKGELLYENPQDRRMPKGALAGRRGGETLSIHHAGQVEGKESSPKVENISI